MRRSLVQQAEQGIGCRRAGLETWEGEQPVPGVVEAPVLIAATQRGGEGAWRVDERAARLDEQNRRNGDERVRGTLRERRPPGAPDGVGGQEIREDHVVLGARGHAPVGVVPEAREAGQQRQFATVHDRGRPRDEGRRAEDLKRVGIHARRIHVVGEAEDQRLVERNVGRASQVERFEPHLRQDQDRCIALA